MSVIVCLSVLFVCVSLDNITEKRVNGFSWNVRDRSGMVDGTIWNHLGSVTFNPLSTGFLFCVFNEIRVCLQHYGKTDWRIFMKFSAKVEHETMNHFRDDAINSLTPGSIFLFPGSVFVRNVMEKRVNGFSWNSLRRTARWLQLQPSSAWPRRRKRSKMFSLCTTRITARPSWDSSGF